MVFLAQYHLCLQEKNICRGFWKDEKMDISHYIEKYLHCTVPNMSIYDAGLSLLFLGNFMYFIIKAMSGMWHVSENVA